MRGKKRIAEWIRIGIFAAFGISLALLGVYQGSKWLADRGGGTAGKLAELESQPAGREWDTKGREYGVLCVP